MPTCAALGCSRRGDPILKVFPRKDHRRRQIWVDRVNRPGWTPSKYSALCERHFDRDQWELPRQDGKRKLKDSALPTVFIVAPPPNGEGIFVDHAYCLPNYRKIYEDDEAKTDNSDQLEDTIPIEHIKVESGENENFTPETLEEEEEEMRGAEIEEVGGERREEGNNAGEEFIQCTPDIFLFPEKDEPFPIEVVECEAGDSNEFLAEPDMDPLAISADDQVVADTRKPFFGNRQKFLFVPKPTKVMVNLPVQTKGEPKLQPLGSTDFPVINGYCQDKSSLTNPPAAKGRLKVKSLDGLLDPNVVLKSQPCKIPKVDPKTTLRSPSAVYLKENLTLVPRKRIEIEQKMVTLTSPEFKFPSNIKVAYKRTVEPPKLNLVSQKLIVKKDPNFVRKMPNLVVEKPVVLPSRPNIMIRKQNDLKMVYLSNPKVKLIQPGLLKSDAQHILANKNIKIAFKPGDQSKNDSVERLNEESKTLSFTDTSMKLFGEQTGKHVKPGTDLNKPQDKSKTSETILTSKKIVKPKVIVLAPYKNHKSQISSDNDASDKYPEEILNVESQSKRERKRSLTLFKCSQCDLNFLTRTGLLKHKTKTHQLDRNNMNVENSSFVDGTSEYLGDSSSSSTISEKIASAILTSEDDSETLSADEIIDGGSRGSETESAAEGNVAQVVKKANIKRRTVNKSADHRLKTAQHVRSYLNRYAQSLEVSNTANPHKGKTQLKPEELSDGESNESLRGNQTSEMTHLDKEGSKTEENQLTERLTRENILNFRNKVSQKLMVSAQKVEHSKKNKNGILKLKDNVKEKELLVISSSSCSSSSQSSTSDSEDDSDIEISTSLKQRNLILPRSQVKPQYTIKDMIQIKKAMCEKIEKRLNLNQSQEKNSLSHSFDENDNSKKPTVLKLRLGPKKIQNPNIINNCSTEPLEIEDHSEEIEEKNQKRLKLRQGQEKNSPLHSLIAQDNSTRPIMLKQKLGPKKIKNFNRIVNFKTNSGGGIEEIVISDDEEVTDVQTLDEGFEKLDALSDAEVTDVQTLDESFENSDAISDAEVTDVQTLDEYYEKSDVISDAEVTDVQTLDESFEKSDAISDAEVTNVQSLDECFEKSDAISDVGYNNSEGEDEYEWRGWGSPEVNLSKEEKLIDLTLEDNNEIKKKPIVLPIKYFEKSDAISDAEVTDVQTLNESFEKSDAEVTDVQTLDEYYEKSDAISDAEVTDVQTLDEYYEKSDAISDAEVTDVQTLDESFKKSDAISDAEVTDVQTLDECFEKSYAISDICKNNSEDEFEWKGWGSPEVSLSKEVKLIDLTLEDNNEKEKKPIVLLSKLDLSEFKSKTMLKPKPARSKVKIGNCDDSEEDDYTMVVVNEVENKELGGFKRKIIGNLSSKHTASVATKVWAVESEKEEVELANNRKHSCYNYKKCKTDKTWSPTNMTRIAERRVRKFEEESENEIKFNSKLEPKKTYSSVENPKSNKEQDGNISNGKSLIYMKCRFCGEIVHKSRLQSHIRSKHVALISVCKFCKQQTNYRKHSCYEMYKTDITLSQTNMTRFAERRVRKFEESEDEMKFNSKLEPKKTYTSVENPKSYKEQDGNISNAKSLIFSMKCKFCGEIVCKSRLLSHMHSCSLKLVL